MKFVCVNKSLCDVWIMVLSFQVLLQARSGLLEGSLKLKNLFGYGDLWDGSLNFGWDQISEVSAGLSLPRSTGVFAFTPMARVSLLSPDLLKMSSYKDQLLGLSYGMSFGLLTSTTHDITYNFSWRKLQDPSEMSSVPVWTQFTRGLNSAVKYTYKVDKRNSPLRPTRGYAFQSATQFGGPVFDCWRSGVSRQVRCTSHTFPFPSTLSTISSVTFLHLLIL